MVGKIARHEHRIGLRPDRAHGLDRRGESLDGPLAGPRGADVRIAELSEEERGLVVVVAHLFGKANRVSPIWRSSGRCTDLAFQVFK